MEVYRDGGENDGIRENQRFREALVYTRRKKNTVASTDAKNNPGTDTANRDNKVNNDERSANPTTSGTLDTFIREEDGISVERPNEKSLVEVTEQQETATLGDTVENGSISFEIPDLQRTVILKDAVVDEVKTIEKEPQDNSDSAPKSQKVITMAESPIVDVEVTDVEEKGVAMSNEIPVLQQTMTVSDTIATDEEYEVVGREHEHSLVNSPVTLTLGNTAVIDEKRKDSEKRPGHSSTEVLKSHKDVSLVDEDMVELEGRGIEKEPECPVLSSAHTAVPTVEGNTSERNDNSVEVLESQQAVSLVDMAVIDGQSVQEEPGDNLIKLPESQQAVILTDATVIGKEGKTIEKELNDNTTKSSHGIVSVNLKGTSLMQRLPVSLQHGKSDDPSHQNTQQVAVEAMPLVLGDVQGVVKQGFERTVKINLALKSKQEKRDLRMKLENELEMARSMIKRIEAKEAHHGVSGISMPQGSISAATYSKPMTACLDMGPVGILHESSFIRTPAPTPRQSRLLNQLIMPLDNSRGVIEHVEKEKRTPKANQLYKNSEFLLAKDKFPPAESNKKSKLNGKKQLKGDVGPRFRQGTKTFKSCSGLLEKLMKHKYGWVFNSPVDAKALGLHDYFLIIKHPMDLGTIKLRLNSNWYKMPYDFAEDVRLTFRNAMMYNPKGHDVHTIAETLLEMFEEKWAVIKLDYDREKQFLSTTFESRRTLERSQSMVYPPVAGSISTTPRVRTAAGKKPKAKDPHKREMTLDEKNKLSSKLQNLPHDKLQKIVQIINKSGSSYSEHAETIEIDMGKVDTETLWELDRFVTNYKKNLSKYKRKAEIAKKTRAEDEQRAAELSPAPVVADALKETKTDERNVSTSLPAQQDEAQDSGSSSSDSSSDSGSSSSDSDGSSSSSSEQR